MGVVVSVRGGREMRTYGLKYDSIDSRPSRVFRVSPSLSTGRSSAYIASRFVVMSDNGVLMRFRPMILSLKRAGCTGRSQGWWPVGSGGQG